MEELQRQAAWAETFGLPLHLVSAEEAQKLFPPMSIDGRARSRLPDDRRLPRPEPAHAGAGQRCPPARRHDPHRHAGHRHRGRPAAGCAPSRPTRAASSARSSSTPAASTPTRSGAWPACTSRSCRWRTSTSSPSRPACPGTCRPCATLRLLVYFRGESGGLVAGRLRAQPGGVGPRRHPGRLQQPSARAGLGALRARSSRRRRPGCPSSPMPRSSSSSTAPRPSRPTASSSSARSEVARLLGGGGLLRPRHRGLGRHGPAHGRVDRRRPARARHLGDGLAPLRPAVPQPRLRPRAHHRGLRHLLRRQVPRPRAPVGQATAPAARLSRASRRSGRASARKAGGSGSTGSSRNVAAGDEALRPDRLGGAALVPGRRAPSTRRAARRPALFDETSFSKLEVLGPGAAGFLEHMCANRVARRAGDGHLHPALQPGRGRRVRPDRHPPRRGPFPHRHRHGLREPRPRLAAGAPALGRLGPDRGRHLALRLLRPLGPERAGDPAAGHRDGPLQRRVRLHDRPGGLRRPRAVPGPPRHLRRRARLGALLPLRVRRAPVGHPRRGGAGTRARRRRLQGDRVAPLGEGLPRLGQRRHLHRHAFRSRARLCRADGQGGELHRARRPRGRRGAEQTARLPRPRRPAHGRARIRAGAHRRTRRRPGHERRLRLQRLHARSPTPTFPPASSRPAGAWRSASSAASSAARSSPSPCSTRPAPACGRRAAPARRPRPLPPARAGGRAPRRRARP